MMADQEPLYSAEQIVVPAGFPEIAREYMKEVLRAQPSDILAFSAEYFIQKLNEAQAKANADGQ